MVLRKDKAEIGNSHLVPFILLVALCISFRLGFVLAAGGQQLTFHSGGSDAPTYVLLAHNLLAHRGFSYAGQPSAFRPPAYPILVSGFMSVFGSRYLLTLRLAQFALGLLTVGFCAAAASRLFGKGPARASLLMGLFLGTLIFPTAQVLTECFAALLTSVFFFLIVYQHQRNDLGSAAGLGVTGGLGTLTRFNSAVLPLFAAFAIFRSREGKLRFEREALFVAVAALIVSPWLIRNEMVSHGQVLLSSHGGPNAVMGILTPQGRTQPGDSEKLLSALGWSLSQLETNEATRLSLPSEAELNRRAWQLVPGLWKEKGWSAIPMLGMKVSDFWLSTDQLMSTGSFGWTARIIRFGGVLSYWVVLVFAIGGWFALRAERPDLASMFLIYAIGITILHLPLVMNTRLRIPLVDPLLVILCGAGWAKFTAACQRSGPSRP